MKARAVLALKLVLLAALGSLLYVTNDLFFLVGSSAVISHLIAPPLPVQVLEFLVCAACLLAPWNGKFRFALPMLALVAALLSSHRLIVDNFNHRLSDKYLTITAQTMPLDPDGGALNIRLSPASAIVEQTSTKHTMRVVSPVLVGLNRGKLTALTLP